MLIRPGGKVHWPPFDGGQVHWHFFARNAIFHACRRLDLAGGDVLMPSYHHGVEVDSVMAAGAKPKFYRVDERWRVDLDDLGRRIGPKTKALYLTHFAGFPGPAAAMRKMADDHGLLLIEDCALSLLSAAGDRPLGSDGDVSIFCLYKTLPVPNGGAALFNRPCDGQAPSCRRPATATVFSLAASSLLQNMEMRSGRIGSRVRSAIRGLAHRAVRAGQVHRVPVGTMRFNPADADLGISPLSLAIARRQNAARIIGARRRNYMIAHNRLEALAPPLFEGLPPGACPLFYPLWVDDKACVMARLRALGIQAVDFWGEHHPACESADFPDTLRARRHVVEIPCHQDLSEATMNWVIDQVVATLTGRKKDTDHPVFADA
ncbi:MAG: DegT/DnrJ/EryC1/StrS family aminotransferase [Wenzhouxiangella sp.]